MNNNDRVRVEVLVDSRDPQKFIKISTWFDEEIHVSRMGVIDLYEQLSELDEIKKNRPTDNLRSLLLQVEGELHEDRHSKVGN